MLDPNRRNHLGRLALAAALALSLIAPLAAQGASAEAVPEDDDCPCRYLGIGLPWREYAEPAKLSALIDGKAEAYILVDVREKDEYEAGHIRTAINIPVGSLLKNPPTAQKDALIIVYCRSGKRSARAQGILEGLGYKGVIDFGGIDRWKEELTIGPKP
jgi:rhodanese-related sulfurtransferase